MLQPRGRPVEALEGVPDPSSGLDPRVLGARAKDLVRSPGNPGRRLGDLEGPKSVSEYESVPVRVEERRGIEIRCHGASRCHVLNVDVRECRVVPQFPVVSRRYRVNGHQVSNSRDGKLRRSQGPETREVVVHQQRQGCGLRRYTAARSYLSIRGRHSTLGERDSKRRSCDIRQQVELHVLSERRPSSDDFHGRGCRGLRNDRLNRQVHWVRDSESIGGHVC